MQFTTLVMWKHAPTASLVSVANDVWLTKFCALGKVICSHTRCVYFSMSPLLLVLLLVKIRIILGALSVVYVRVRPVDRRTPDTISCYLYVCARLRACTQVVRTSTPRVPLRVVLGEAA